LFLSLPSFLWRRKRKSGEDFKIKQIKGEDSIPFEEPKEVDI
jgi:hypothetical protein